MEKERIENEKKGIYFPLLPVTEEDREKATQVFKGQKRRESFGLPVKIDAEQTRQKRKLEIKSSSIFGQNTEQHKLRLQILEKLRIKNITPQSLTKRAKVS